MLQITIPETEIFNEITSEFIYVKQTNLRLEHSLLSISKWEENWGKSYIDTDKKTREETLDYIRCMTITPNVDPNVYRCITNPIMQQINQYIDRPMTATRLPKPKPSAKKKIITSEEIYYQMFELGIPLEFEKRHLNRLLMQIRVCQAYREPAKKRSTSEIISSHRAINEANKKRFKTKG